MKYNKELWQKKYKFKDEENINDTFDRVAGENDDIFFEMTEGNFISAGRQLAGKNTNTDRTLFNCYVVDFRNINHKGKDSRDSIMDLNKRCADITARGGGIGINFSTLRPKNSEVKSTKGRSSGAVSFMKVISETQKEITQAGIRRGALIFLLEAWHPDILDFISVKEDLDILNNANLSIAVSDDFMQAVENNENWDLKFPDTTFEKYDEEWDGDIKKWQEKDYPVKLYETIKAKELYNKLVKLAWQNGEPGMLFLDTINNNSNIDKRISACNPCGEVPLLEDEICNLGAINLANFVKDKRIEFDKLKTTVKRAVRYLDNVIDEENYNDKNIKKMQKHYRRIGLGVMGFATMLIKLEIKYGSQKSIEIINKVMRTILDHSYRTSAKLAKEKGKAPYFSDNINKNDNALAIDKTGIFQQGFYRDYKKHIFLWHKLSEKTKDIIRSNGLRNTHILSIAPTGSISMLLEVSSGIEPYFKFEYTRNDQLGKRKIKEPILEELGLKGDEDFLITSHEITPEKHIDIQAKFQEYIDNSISKTINLPKNYSLEKTKEIFINAWQKDLKGITIYRDGSREGVYQSNDNNQKEIKSEIWIHDRAKEMDGITKSFKTACGNLYITINFDENKKPFETFLTVGNGGGCVSNLNAISRLVSLLLRSGIPVSEIIDQLSSTFVCPAMQYARGKGKKVEGKNCPSILAKFLKDNSEVKDKEEIVKDLNKCPECGAELIQEEGCINCHVCGWSKC